MPTEQPTEAIITSMRGSLTFQHDLAFPFLTEVVEALDDVGIPELDDSQNFTPPSWWEERKTTQLPTAFLDPVSLVVAIVLFSRAPAGAWAIDRICDTLWEKAARPALTGLVGKRKPGSSGGSNTVRFRIGTWFEEDKLFVEVVADLEPGDNGRALEQLVPQAFRLVADRIATQTERRVLTVPIQDGKLGEPIESDRPIP